MPTRASRSDSETCAGHLSSAPMVRLTVVVALITVMRAAASIGLKAAYKHGPMARRAKTPHWLSAARERGRTGNDWLLRALGRAGAVEGGLVADAISAGRVRVDGKV